MSTSTTAILPNRLKTKAITPGRGDQCAKDQSRWLWPLLFVHTLLSVTPLVLSTAARMPGILGGMLVLEVLLLSGFVVNDCRKGAIGRAMLMVSVIGCFTLEAFVSSLESPAFVLPHIGHADDAIVAECCAYVGLFSLCLFIGYKLPLRMKRLAGALGRRTERTGAVNILISWVAALSAYVSITISSNYDPGTMLRALFTSSSYDASLRFELTNPGLVEHWISLGLFGAALWLCRSLEGPRWRRILRFTVAVAACAPVILGGTRHLIVYIVTPLILLLFGRGRTRVARASVAKVVLVALLCAVTFQAMLYFRSRGVTSLRDITLTDIGEVKTNFQFDSLLLSRYLCPDQYGFIHESMAWYFLIHWVPRSLWPGKPIPEVLTIFNVGNGVDMSTGNLTPSVIGQYYMCWGVWGVIGIALMIGGITRLADSVVLHCGMQLSMPFVVALGSLYAGISCSFRYFSPFYFSHVIVALVCAYILTTKAARCDAGTRIVRIGAR